MNPNAFDAGGFVNVTVDVPLNCLLKLFAVDKSNVALPPVPKSEYVSLYVVDATLPVTDKVVPSKVKLLSTLAFGVVPFNVSTPLSVAPVKVKNPEVPDVIPGRDVPDVPDVTPKNELPEEPPLPAVADVPLLPK